MTRIRLHTSTASDRSAPETLLLALLLVAFLALLVRTAWVCDDAYITFRVADNALHGHGLRWNVADRVQAFTNPLWLFLMTGAYALTGDVYYTSLFLSCVLSLAAVMFVAFRAAVSPAQAMLAVSTLALSKAFVDYSTSGLENPLGHLLLAIFFGCYLRDAPGERSFTRLALLAGLLVFNRLDALLLVGPPLLVAALGLPLRPTLRSAVLGSLPVLCWMAFACFYYGFPLPNTAYAKLNTGIPSSELLQQGVLYLFDSLSIDPLTLVVISLATCVPLALGFMRGLPVALALLLHLAYVVRAGGDFMSGRFLAAPLLVAVILLACAPFVLKLSQLAMGLLIVGAIALSGPSPSLRSSAFYFADRAERHSLLDARGITDERAIYYRYTGLLTAHRGEPMPNHHRAAQGRRLRALGEQVVEQGQIGILGFYAGPAVHILESNALTDAFLARLPARPGWRIGHFGRRIPVGYEGSLRRNTNRLEDPELRALYRTLRLVTRGSLFTWSRLAAIWDLNFGAGPHAIDSYFATHAGVRKLKLADVSAPRNDGDGEDAGTQRFSEWGVEVALGRVRHLRTIEVSLDSNDVYKLVCLNSDIALAEQGIGPRIVPEGGLSVRRVEMARDSSRLGCDTLRILPVGGDQSYSLGHVALIDELTPEELKRNETPAEGGR